MTPLWLPLDPTIPECIAARGWLWTILNSRAWNRGLKRQGRKE